MLFFRFVASPHVNDDQDRHEAHHAAWDPDQCAAQQFVAKGGNVPQATEFRVGGIKNGPLEREVGADDDVGKNHDPQHHQAHAVAGAHGRRPGIENAPEEEEAGNHHADVHEVMHVIVQQRQIVELRNLPEVKRADKKSRHRHRVREDAEGVANDAVGDHGSHNAALCPIGRAGDQKALRGGEEQQHRPDHAKQQVLDLAARRRGGREPPC